MEALYKFHFDCYRGGTLRGLFIEDKERVEKLIKSRAEIYFREVAGKHSEIIGPLDEEDLTLVTDDASKIQIIRELSLEMGFNPVQTYIDHEEDQGRTHVFSESEG